MTKILKLLWAYFFPKSYALAAKPEELTFHYVSQAVHPDYIQVWQGKRYLTTYLWVDGENAYPESELGKLHAIYESKRKR